MQYQDIGNNEENAYFEVFAKKKHVCPNRTNKTTATKPNYYSKKVMGNKAKMSNSFELFSGPIDTIQKEYEILSDILSEFGGKIHDSQRDRDPKTGLLDLLVYYEVIERNREEVKKKFENFTRSHNIVLQK